MENFVEKALQNKITPQLNKDFYGLHMQPSQLLLFLHHRNNRPRPKLGKNEILGGKRKMLFI